MAKTTKTKPAKYADNRLANWNWSYSAIKKLITPMLRIITC
jgi:hypothetical protein